MEEVNAGIVKKLEKRKRQRDSINDISSQEKEIKTLSESIKTLKETLGGDNKNDLS